MSRAYARVAHLSICSYPVTSSSMSPSSRGGYVSKSGRGFGDLLTPIAFERGRLSYLWLPGSPYYFYFLLELRPDYLLDTLEVSYCSYAVLPAPFGDTNASNEGSSILLFGLISGSFNESSLVLKAVYI